MLIARLFQTDDCCFAVCRHDIQYPDDSHHSSHGRAYMMMMTTIIITKSVSCDFNRIQRRLFAELSFL
jgi:hypothetical protein